MNRLKRNLVDVSKELNDLQHNAQQNKELPKLPASTTVSKRPINHAPISSPFAGSKVQKVVYVSRKTPVMSAVKRVKRFLREIEKRALQSQGIDGILDKAGYRGQGKDDILQKKLEDVGEKMRRDAEEVLVKASGRAMEQALRIAEWFRTRETDVLTNVEVRTGSVSVIDDVVEKDGESEDYDSAPQDTDNKEIPDTQLEGGDTTMELLQNLGENSSTNAQSESHDTTCQQASPTDQPDQQSSSNGKRKRKRRKRKEYDADDIPEARIRWVKTVEIAITLQA